MSKIKIYISPDYTLLKALKRMDAINKKLLIVVSDNNFLGLVSIGDLQRAILKGVDLNEQISKILRKNIIVANETDDVEKIRSLMLKYRMEFCPVISSDNRIIKIYYWEELFDTVKPIPKKKFHLPVVIMAGGLGTRMQPLTHVIPKPLIPIGQKTVLEHIIDSFAEYGCNNFLLSVNYKHELIKYYLENQKLPYNIEYFVENDFSGTAGSLSLLEEKINSTFFVINCDILIDNDYSEILEYHYNNKNEITLVGALRHFPIDYGTIETGINGELISLIEKPELTFKINSGMYILEPHLINEIPKDTFFHITHLINKVKDRGGKVGVFPITEKSWIDIGSWTEYFKFIKQ